MRASIEPRDVAIEAEALLARFPNARVNADERRQLRAALYRPLLPLPQAERSRLLDTIIPLLLDDANE